MKTEEKVALVREHMRNTLGTDGYYQHWTGMVHTSGIDYLAKTLGAYWFIDVIASWQPEITEHHPDHAGFQVWELRRVSESKFEMTAWSDTPRMEACEEEGQPASVLLAKQEIAYTNFPEEMMPLVVWVEGGVLILREEH